MKCFPFCAKTKVKRIKPLKQSAGRINVLQAKKDDKTEPNAQKVGEISSNCEDFEYVVCSYDTLDTERGLSSCVQDIFGSMKACGRSQADCDAVCSCQSESNLSEQVLKNGTSFHGEGRQSSQKSATKLQELATLGRKIQVSRSLQDYIGEAKRKHLPPLHGLKKSHCRDSDRTRGLKSIRGKAGSGILLLKKKEKVEDSFILQAGSDPFKRSVKLLDASFPRMLYPEMTALNRGSLDQEDWSSIEDILSIDLSTHSFQKPNNTKSGKGDVVRKRDSGFGFSRGKMSTDDVDKEKDSVCHSNSKHGHVELESRNNAVSYDESELELMENIEKQFAK